MPRQSHRALHSDDLGAAPNSSLHLFVNMGRPLDPPFNFEFEFMSKTKDDWQFNAIAKC